MINIDKHWSTWAGCCSKKGKPCVSRPLLAPRFGTKRHLLRWNHCSCAVKGATSLWDGMPWICLTCQRMLGLIYFKLILSKLNCCWEKMLDFSGFFMDWYEWPSILPSSIDIWLARATKPRTDEVTWVLRRQHVAVTYNKKRLTRIHKPKRGATRGTKES